MFLPAFDDWRSGGNELAASPATAAIGTLDWVFAEYRADAGTRSSIQNLSGIMRPDLSSLAATS